MSTINPTPEQLREKRRQFNALVQPILDQALEIIKYAPVELELFFGRKLSNQSPHVVHRHVLTPDQINQFKAMKTLIELAGHSVYGKDFKADVLRNWPGINWRSSMSLDVTYRDGNSPTVYQEGEE